MKTLQRETMPFIVASFVNATGSALMWPLITIYVHNVLHQSYAAAGWVLFLQSGAGIIGQIAGGSLYHRLGPLRLITGSLALQGIAQIALIFTHTWLLYAMMMTINGFLFAVTMPAVNAFVGFRWAAQRRALFNTIYVCNNIGVAVGTSMAGLLATISFNFTFLLNGVSTLAFGGFFLWYVKRADAVKRATAVDADSGDTEIDGGILPQPRALLRAYHIYLLLAIGSLSIWFATASWNSGIAPYLNQRGMGVTGYSFLWTINGALILLGQPLIGWFNRRAGRELIWRLVAGTLLYTCAFALMGAEHGYYLDLVAGMVLGTFGEMLVNPTVPALVTEITGRAAPFYLGVVGGCSSAGRLIGPPIFGYLFDVAGVTPILAIASLGALVAAACFTLYAKLQKRAVAYEPFKEA